MAFWMLKRCNPHIGLDEAAAFIVEAETPNKARKVIVRERQFGDEGPAPWLSSTQTSCVEVLVTDKEHIVLRDFNGSG